MYRKVHCLKIHGGGWTQIGKVTGVKLRGWARERGRGLTGSAVLNHTFSWSSQFSIPICIKYRAKQMEI